MSDTLVEHAKHIAHDISGSVLYGSMVELDLFPCFYPNSIIVHDCLYYAEPGAMRSQTESGGRPDSDH